MNLENVQAGDTLIWQGRNAAESRVVTVDRLTKTQVIIDGHRFRKLDGYAVGRSVWDTTNVTIPEEGEIEKIQEARLHQQLTYEINGACQMGKLRAFSLEQLQQINTLLNSLLENQ